MKSKISVVIPSRLEKFWHSLPTCFSEVYWFERAINSIKAQTVFRFFDWEVIIGIDKGAIFPSNMEKIDGIDIIIAEGRGRGQSFAVNAAIELAKGDYLAILEDDDLWSPLKIQIQIPFLNNNLFDFVSCNQSVKDLRGNEIYINDYPIPSTWFMKYNTWQSVGRFDEGMKWHMDGDWLGRANSGGIKRVHLVRDEDILLYSESADIRSQTSVGELPSNVIIRTRGNLIYNSEIISTNLGVPLVDRTDNLFGGTNTIISQEGPKMESRIEMELLKERYGECPW